MSKDTKIDELNERHSEDKRVLHNVIEMNQAKIDELQTRIENLLDYAGTSGHTPNWIIKEFLK